eukprot:scaffold24_cov128-Cylindrotheca_fusiformis.AAC.6
MAHPQQSLSFCLLYEKGIRNSRGKKLQSAQESRSFAKDILMWIRFSNYTWIGATFTLSNRGTDSLGEVPFSWRGQIASVLYAEAVVDGIHYDYFVGFEWNESSNVGVTAVSASSYLGKLGGAISLD